MIAFALMFSIASVVLNQNINLKIKTIQRKNLSEQTIKNKKDLKSVEKDCQNLEKKDLRNLVQEKTNN